MGSSINYRAFKNLSNEEIKSFIRYNYKALIGSAMFTNSDKLVSKIIQWIEKKSFKGEVREGDFIPSHVGSIIEYNNDIYVFNMVPPRASIITLQEFLKNTKNPYELVYRKFPIDTRMFSLNIAYHIGEFYPYLSALRSVLTKRQTKWVRHCSELHLREIQKQGYFIGVNPEITPLELYRVFINN